MLPGERDASQQYSVHYLLLEMAPLSLYPHTVNVFLNQVDAGLWDGTDFWSNRDHILMTRLEDPDGQSRQQQPNGGPDQGKMSRFRELGLDRLSFPEVPSFERSTEQEEGGWNHEKYTVGLAGRPLPGPLFYINKRDNAEYHSEDPCFARVVEMAGDHALVDKMSEMERGKEDELSRPVRILEGYVLVWQDDKEEEEAEGGGRRSEGQRQQWEVGPQPPGSAPQLEMSEEWLDWTFTLKKTDAKRSMFDTAKAFCRTYKGRESHELLLRQAAERIVRTTKSGSMVS